MNDYDCLVKVLIIGDSEVGKSSLMLRFTDDDFTESSISTIGVDFRIKTATLADNRKAKMQIWDTAGQERFRTITSTYYRGAHAILLVYDITNVLSFESVINWVADIEKYANPKVKKILVGNKVDKKEDRQVSIGSGQSLAYYYNMPFIETSARTSFNVERAFLDIANEYCLSIPKDNKPQPSLVFKVVDIKTEESSCFC